MEQQVCMVIAQTFVDVQFLCVSSVDVQFFSLPCLSYYHPNDKLPLLTL